jgi:hypothetical protein
MSVPNSRRHGDIIITFGTPDVEQTSLSDCRRLSHGCIIITSDVEEISLQHSRRQSHGNIIKFGVEKMLAT